MNFAFHRDSGEYETCFTLERQVSNVIEWDFTSINDVNLLIIKRSTLEYYERVASELSSKWGADYGQLMGDFLEDDYVSRGKHKDSGKFYVDSPGLHIIKFSTGGTINYIVKCDPFFIDLMWIFYGILGISTTIGGISSYYNIKKIIKMKIINEKSKICQRYQSKYSCEHCGVDLDSDSIFCYECGDRLKKYS